jgi:hypothetical protein
MPDRVDVEAPNRRPSVVVVVLPVSLARVYNPLEDSGVSLRSRPTAFRPDDTEIPESSDREPWWEYDDELDLQTRRLQYYSFTTVLLPGVTTK